ncbi:MAG: cyclopropane fatty acyl phospholipid synthase [Desulforhopalus sp.]
MGIFSLTSPPKYIQNMLGEAGIVINGKQPWDIQVRNPRLFDRILTQGSLALGESYMEGWWDCKALDEFIHKILQQRLHKTITCSPPVIYNTIKAVINNCQSGKRAREVGEKHYDTDNQLFSLMLDKYMVYSCGYWQDSETLDEAQQAKLDLICRKLRLKKGMRLLDIGCGWGSLVRFAAENYGVEAVGITISREQVEMARQLCDGLPVDIRFQDYRQMAGEFDAVVSVGMFEHVGYKNYRSFMEVVNRCLKKDGLFLLHTIANNKTTKIGDPWFDKYIFPNGMLPSPSQLTSALEKWFIIEDWHNFGVYYDRTLMAWYQNFCDNWPKLKQKYSHRFYRMWSYYLLSMAGSFRARYLQVWQVVLSPKGRRGGYSSIRCSNCPS